MKLKVLGIIFFIVFLLGTNQFLNSANEHATKVVSCLSESTFCEVQTLDEIDTDRFHNLLTCHEFPTIISKELFLDRTFFIAELFNNQLYKPPENS